MERNLFTITVIVMFLVVIGVIIGLFASTIVDGMNNLIGALSGGGAPKQVICAPIFPWPCK